MEENERGVLMMFGNGKSKDGNEKYFIKSSTGAVLKVYEDHVVLTQEGARGFITRGLAGEKTIYFSDITSVQFRKCGFAPGFMEFTFPGSNDRPGGAESGSENENRFTFNSLNQKKINDEMVKANTFIESQVKKYRQGKSSDKSNVDELIKLKNLLDSDVITKEEFDSEKQKILSN